ncbi:unnamed protein product [Phyllotreta striolata]|uniref:Uncharacterized protein n=1 Tax=Phyllotreta striolata TaxID=444603 RepID=A0A9P0GU52_PHYSR|nr:unnamed protein product [Phyllotreta striolata]
MNTKKDYSAFFKPYERGLELDTTSNAVNLDNLESFFGILTVFFRFQDYYVFKMNTKKDYSAFFKPYERGLELDTTSNAVNLDNLESFLGILKVFFRFQDYYVFKMNTEKDYSAVSSLMRED